MNTFREDFYVGTQDQSECPFFESFVGTQNPDDNHYCLPFCHIGGGDCAEICLGNHRKCPLTGGVYLHLHKGK